MVGTSPPKDGPLGSGEMAGSFAGNASFRSSGQVTESGDCMVEKAGMMRATHTVLDALDPLPDELVELSAVAVSAHSSDDELVLVCMDCGKEIIEDSENCVCPLTGKLHA